MAEDESWYGSSDHHYTLTDFEKVRIKKKNQ